MSEKSIDIDKIKALIAVNAGVNASNTDPDKVLISIMEAAMRLVKCESSSVLFLNKEDGTLRFTLALGPKGAEAKSIAVSKNSIAGWVIQHNQSVVINDVGSDFRFNSLVQDKTLYVTRNIIAVPMCIGEECVGVIEVLNKFNNEDFNADDLNVMQLVGFQAGVAYANASVMHDTVARVKVLQDAVDKGDGYHTFVSESSVIRDMMSVVGRVAKTNSSVLIIGESGVGKELFAEQIHKNSNRKDMPFVRVSCAALAPQLLESELFGHVKGAYTGADSDQKGRFEIANGGTLFLDEIGEMPLNLQSKLLRALHEKKFEKVGSSKTISVDVRIIAATNRDLEQMVRDKTFRDDLYYRLNVFPLNIPALRNRKEDIIPLSNFFLNKYSLEIKKNFEGFSLSSVDALLQYSWPGNVRELENTVERACILGAPPLIQLNDLRLPLVETVSAINSFDDISGISSEVSLGDDKTLNNAMNIFKKRYVEKILMQTRGNQTEAAKILGIQRTYLSRLIRELGIRRLD